jgi:membrane-bound ClpP family serine protease
LTAVEPFVEKKDRQATQTLIRTLSEGMSATESDSVSPAEIIGKVLNLTAKEAVELELVDGTADSTADILAEMQLSESKLTPVSGVEKVMKKFTAARRNIINMSKTFRH